LPSPLLKGAGDRTAIVSENRSRPNPQLMFIFDKWCGKKGENAHKFVHPRRESRCKARFHDAQSSKAD